MKPKDLLAFIEKVEFTPEMLIEKPRHHEGMANSARALGTLMGIHNDLAAQALGLAHTQPGSLAFSANSQAVFSSTTGMQGGNII